MTNVVNLGKADIASDRRDSFLKTAAASFEKYVALYGHEPDALVYVMCGIKQTAMVAWTIEGESQEGTVSTIALASVSLSAQAVSYREPTND